MNFDRLTQYLDALDDWNIPARDLIITKDGQQVYRHFSGCHDEAGLCPIDGKEVYWIYSMTKPMTMACVLKLMQEGRG